MALIIGASRGLGAAFAESLAQTHHIVAVGRTTGALEELDDRIQAKGGQATLAPMDITQKEAMAHLCKSLFERWGSIDMWVHTAIHVAPLTPAATLDAKDWEKSVAVNVTATGILIPFIAPLLRDTSTALFFEDFQARQKFFPLTEPAKRLKSLWPKYGLLSMCARGLRSTSWNQPLCQRRPGRAFIQGKINPN